MAEGVFISYRRDDVPGHAGRLYDSLVADFGAGRVFMDVDSIDPGVDFVEMIEATLANAAVVVVVIGPGWLHARDELGGQRLSESGDFVHLEVRRALELDKRVIPVLVDGARPPGVEELPDDLAPLARRNAFDVSDIRFHSDINRLAVAIDKLLAPPPTAVVPAAAAGTAGITPGKSIGPASAPDAPDGPVSAASAAAAVADSAPPALLGETSHPASTPPPLLVGPVRRRRWLLPVVILGVILVVGLLAWLVSSGGSGTGNQADSTSEVTEAASDQSATAQGSSAEPTDGAATAGDGAASTPALAGTIATGAHPVEAEVVDDDLWVQVDGGLERYPASGDDPNATTTIDLGGNGNDIVPGDGVLYVMLMEAQEVAVIDLTTDEVDRIAVGAGPLAGALLDDTLWVTAHGDFDGAPGVVVPIADGAAGTPIPLDDKPFAVIADDDALWVTFAESDGLAQIDPATGDVTRYSVGPAPIDVQAIDDQLWVTLSGADQVAIVEPTDGVVVDSVDVGTRPWKLTEGFGAVWVSNRGDEIGPGSVSRIDPSSLMVTGTVATEAQTDELAIGPSNVFAVNHGSDTFSVISPGS